MSKTYLLILSFSIILFGCSEDDENDCVRASGNIFTEKIVLPELITGINLVGSGRVTLTPRPRQRITVTTSDNIVPLVTTSIFMGTWTIDFTSCVNNLSDFEVEITTPLIEDITLTGSGEIVTTAPFSPSRGSIILTGSGAISHQLNAEEVGCVITGSGSISLSGESEVLNADLIGSGSIRAFPLMTNVAWVAIPGSGQVEVTVADSLDVSISGSGSVTYRGDPSVTQRISGSGTVQPE